MGTGTLHPYLQGIRLVLETDATIHTCRGRTSVQTVEPRPCRTKTHITGAYLRDTGSPHLFVGHIGTITAVAALFLIHKGETQRTYNRHTLRHIGAMPVFQLGIAVIGLAPVLKTGVRQLLRLHSLYTGSQHHQCRRGTRYCLDCFTEVILFHIYFLSSCPWCSMSGRRLAEFLRKNPLQRPDFYRLQNYCFRFNTKIAIHTKEYTIFNQFRNSHAVFPPSRFPFLKILRQKHLTEVHH